MATKTVTVSITIPADLLVRLDGVAAGACVKRSWLISRVVEGWLSAIERTTAEAGIDPATVVNAAIAEAVEIGR